MNIIEPRPMKTDFQTLCYLLFFGITSPVNATDVDLDQLIGAMEKICASTEKLSPPPQDHPDATIQKELENGCDPLSLYYGFDQEPDYIKARQCGFAGRGDGDWGWGDFVIAMLYANGKGVQRNLDLATHYACKVEGTLPADKAYQVDYLQKLKLSKNAQEDFDMCAHVFSNPMILQCFDIKSRLETRKREEEWTLLKSKCTLPQQKAFDKLREASQVFFGEHVERETDKSGRLFAAIMSEEHSDLEKQMLKMLKACDQCKFPTFTLQQFQDADKQLNTLYKKAMNTEFPDSWGISPSGIKTTQRAWIKYRDAWVAFGHEKCPNISTESWKTIITNERVTQLSSLANM